MALTIFIISRVGAYRIELYATVAAKADLQKK